MGTSMSPRAIALLVLSSLANGVIGAGAFLFAVFATDPAMSDVTMRVGYYVLNAVTIAAGIAVMAPWVLAWRGRVTAAAIVAVLPAVLAALAVIAVLTLDSWLRRTFSG